MQGMRTGIVVVVCLLAGCASSTALTPGRWAGTIAPMNHPDRTSSITYDVSYANSQIVIDIMGPDGTIVSTRSPALSGDTLRFEFDEPEQGETLTCALGRTVSGSYAGRCADRAGKWAWFTMRPSS